MVSSVVADAVFGLQDLVTSEGPKYTVPQQVNNSMQRLLCAQSGHQDKLEAGSSHWKSRDLISGQ